MLALRKSKIWRNSDAFCKDPRRPGERGDVGLYFVQEYNANPTLKLSYRHDNM